GDGPGAFEATGHGAVSTAVLPTKALLLERSCFGVDVDTIRRTGSTVRFTEGVTTGDQGDGFFIIHTHAAEGFADVARGEQRVGVAARAFRVHVDQTHLSGAKRASQFAVTAEAAGVTEPFTFRAPVHFFRFPGVFAATSEADGFKAHVFHGHGAGQYQEVGPGQAVAVFLFDWLQQATGFVQVGVIRPAVQRSKALHATVCTTAAIKRAIGASGVPG